jgi:hypothetical protein
LITIASFPNSTALSKNIKPHLIQDHISLKNPPLSCSNESVSVKEKIKNIEEQRNIRRELYDFIQNCCKNIKLNETQKLMKEALLLRFLNGSNILGDLLSSPRKVKRASISVIHKAFRKWVDWEGIDKVKYYVSQGSKILLAQKSTDMSILQHFNYSDSITDE